MHLSAYWVSELAKHEFSWPPTAKMFSRRKVYVCLTDVHVLWHSISLSILIIIIDI